MKQRVVINLPVSGTGRDYQAAVAEAIDAMELAGDTLGAAALAGLLTHIIGPLTVRFIPVDDAIQARPRQTSLKS